MKLLSHSIFACLILIGLTSVMVETAHAEVLLNDGFPTGAKGYCDSTKISLRDRTAASVKIIGFSEQAYTRATGTIFAMPWGSGLAFPQKLIDAGLSTTGSGAAAIGYQNSSGTATDETYRHQSRKISAGTLSRTAGETLYFRGLINVDSTSFGTLVAADGLTVGNNYGMGFWNPTDSILSESTAYKTYITAAERFFYFNFAKTASGTAQIRLSVKTGDSTVSTVALADGATIGATYLCVAKIRYNEDGTQSIFAQAQTIADYDANAPFITVAENVDLFDTSTFSLLFGGNYLTKGAVTFDEFRLATTESEVIVPPLPAIIAFSSSEVSGKETILNAKVQLNSTDSATVELKYSPSADALDTTLSCGTVSQTGSFPVNLGELFPQSWFGQFTISWPDGSYSTPVFSFDSPGIPEWTDVAAGGTLFTEAGIWAKATLGNQGLSETGVAVTLFCGESTDSMTAANVWQGVTAGSEITYAFSEAPAPGSTIYCQFLASYEYQGKTVESRSEIVSVKCEGSEIWTGANGSDWHDADNWSGLAVPNESIDIAFVNGAGQVTATANAFAKSINVTNASTLAIDMGGNTLASGSFALSRSSSSTTLKNGIYDLGTQKWPATGLEKMKLIVAADAIVSSSGTLAYSPANNAVSVYGTFNHSGAVTIGQRWNNSTAGSSLQVLDGGNMSIGSTLSIGWHNSKVIVANASLLTAKAIALGAALSDSGSWATVWVSNATMKVTGNLGIGTDDRTANSVLRVFHDENEPATLIEIEGDVYTSPSGGTIRNGKGNNIVIRGGTMNVKGNIRIDGTTANSARTNMLYVANRDARVTAGSLTLNNTAQLKFKLPETGFDDGVVVNVSGTCAFASANARIVIDASECRETGWQTLLQAGTLTGLTADNLESYLTVSATYKDRQVLTKLVDNQLMVRISGSASAIIIR